MNAMDFRVDQRGVGLLEDPIANKDTALEERCSITFRQLRDQFRATFQQGLTGSYGADRASPDPAAPAVLA